MQTKSLLEFFIKDAHARLDALMDPNKDAEETNAEVADLKVLIDEIRVLKQAVERVQQAERNLLGDRNV